MTHEERVWHHEMETLEGIHEHAERIASLEELVLKLSDAITRMCDASYCQGCALAHVGMRCELTDDLNQRVEELGIEVES